MTDRLVTGTTWTQIVRPQVWAADTTVMMVSTTVLVLVFRSWTHQRVSSCRQVGRFCSWTIRIVYFNHIARRIIDFEKSTSHFSVQWFFCSLQPTQCFSSREKKPLLNFSGTRDRIPFEISDSIGGRQSLKDSFVFPLSFPPPLRKRPTFVYANRRQFSSNGISTYYDKNGREKRYYRVGRKISL